MDSLPLNQADLIADKALEKARASNFRPMTVAVLDAGGYLKVLKREDNSSLLRNDIAIGKAWGTLGMGIGGRDLARRAEKMPSFFASLTTMSDGRMVTVPGGVLIRNKEGEIVGAVGVTGDTAANDELCAVHGIEAANLVADTGD